MKKIILAVSAGILLTLGSCSTSKYMEARSIPVNDVEVFAHPVIANLKVESQRKSWNVTIKRKDAIAMGLNVNNMRAYAIALACKEGKIDSMPVYDAIVGATFVIKSSGKRYEFEVTGFPAKYQSFRNLGKEDMDILRFSGQGNSEMFPKTDSNRTFPFFNNYNDKENNDKK